MAADPKLGGKREAPNGGNGRPKGAQNKTTQSVKDAMLAVYADLQKSSGRDHGHFQDWAEANQTEFYKLWSKLIPVDVKAEVGGQIVVRWLPPEQT
jgi:hypothetical protein